MTLLSSRTTALGRVDRAGSGGLIAGRDVAMGQVGRHAGVGGFWDPFRPPNPSFRGQRTITHGRSISGLEGGVCNETLASSSPTV